MLAGYRIRFMEVGIMKRAVALIIIFLLFTSCIGGRAYTATISGHVYHNNSTTPIANAEVHIKIGKFEKTLITDSEGFFELKVSTNARYGTITIKFIGYQSLTEPIDLKSSSPEKYYLKANSSYDDASFIGGWINFALPTLKTSPASFSPSLALQSVHLIPSAIPTEILIRPFVYSEELAYTLGQEFKAIDIRTKPRLELIILEFPVGADLDELLTQIRVHPEVLEAYPNSFVHSQSIGIINEPNDPLYIEHQWNFPAIYLPQAWAKTTGNRKIRVAIIDTFVFDQHEDLESNIENEYNKRLDETADDSEKPLSHGTHVAGIIGAETNNNIGVAGTMWEVELIPIPALRNSKGNATGTMADLLEALDIAIEEKVDIINLSLGTNGDDPFMYEKIREAYDEGIIIVAAAGNYDPSNKNGKKPMKYPAQYDEVIEVGATNIYHNIADYSANIDVKLFAPGGDNAAWIYSTLPGQDSETSAYGNLGGTSMAAPQVAGLIGLILAEEGKDYTKEELYDRLWQTGTTFDYSNPEWRMVNAYAALHYSNPQNSLVEFRGKTKNQTFTITEIDQLRNFALFLPADQYKVFAHLDVNHNNKLDSGDWYYEQDLVILPNQHIQDFQIELEIYK